LKVVIIFQVGDPMGNSFSHPSHVATRSRVSVLSVYASVSEE